MSDFKQLKNALNRVFNKYKHKYKPQTAFNEYKGGDFLDNESFFNDPYELISYRPFDAEENVNYLGNRSSKEPRLFNFNPEKEEVSVFVAKVLAQLFSPIEWNELKDLENSIVNLRKKEKKTFGVRKTELKEEIGNLKYTLENKSLVKEKLKITIEGFDIDVKPIPFELCLPAKYRSEDHVLSLLRTGYLNNQVLAQFGLSNAEFDVLSKKGYAARGYKGNLIYGNILDLVGKSHEFVEGCLSTKAIPNRKKILKEISKMGEEGKKMHELLCHLREKKFIRKFKSFL
ncbi:MAG: hypothetical protein V4471_02985 [Pseudomonadota bacterium]